MDPRHDSKTRSEQRHEEALQQAREHHLARPGGANAGLASTSVLSGVHGAGLSE